MVLKEDTSIADVAMVRPCRLHLVTYSTLLGPEILQLLDCLGSIAQQLLNVAGKPLKLTVFVIFV